MLKQPTWVRAGGAAGPVLSQLRRMIDRRTEFRTRIFDEFFRLPSAERHLTRAAPVVSMLFESQCFSFTATVVEPQTNSAARHQGARSGQPSRLPHSQTHHSEFALTSGPKTRL